MFSPVSTLWYWSFVCMDFGMRTLMHTSSSTSGCACWMEACWRLDFFAEAMKALLLLDILLLLLIDDGICQLLKSRDDVAVRAVLRDRLALAAACERATARGTFAMTGTCSDSRNSTSCLSSLPNA